MNEPTTTLIGNLAVDPELRFTPSGVAVCKLRVLQTPRRKNAAGELEDGEPFGQDVTCWREMAENVAETLHKGDRVIVHGRLSQRRYEDREGNKRTAWDLEADGIGPDLRFASAAITKQARGNRGAHGDDEWASASKTRPAQQQGGQQAAPQQRQAPANADQQRATANAGAASESPW